MTDVWQLTFARPKYSIGTPLLWHRPTQEPESPIQTLPCFVMGQYADGPYQLFVCSFQGAHMQVAPPEQLTPMPDTGAELLRAVGRDLAALREACDTATKHQIDLEGRIAELESAATAPAPEHKAVKKDGKDGKPS